MDRKSESRNTLKEARERVGKTQVEIAGLLGVSSRTYQNWEAGRHTPRLPLPKYQLLADVLELTLSEVVKLFEQPEQPT